MSVSQNIACQLFLCLAKLFRRWRSCCSGEMSTSLQLLFLYRGAAVTAASGAVLKACGVFSEAVEAFLKLPELLRLMVGILPQLNIRFCGSMWLLLL
jgi:hypothetical protein